MPDAKRSIRAPRSNATGQEEASSKADSLVQDDETGRRDLAVPFASEAAEALAREHQLISEDFKGAEQTAETGFAKADVQAIIDKVLGEESD